MIYAKEIINELNQKVFVFFGKWHRRNEFATDTDRMRAAQYWGCCND